MPGQISITDFHADFADRTGQWSKIRDVIDGEDKIKRQGQTYLPKPSGMADPNQYTAYKDRAAMFPVAERTMRGLSGMVFRHDPVLEVPDRIDDMRKSLTTDGYTFEVLAEEVVREVLTIGRYGILVDFPIHNETSEVLPHFATYFAEDITNWEQQFVHGKKVLTRVVLRDDIDNSTGDDTVVYLELIINAAGVYEVRKWESSVVSLEGTGTGQDRIFTITRAVVPIINGAPLNRIPFVFINTYDMRPDIEKPPFLDLVNVNISHYRNSADYEHALYLTAQPTPWVAGQVDVSQKPKSIGSGTIWTLPEGTTVGLLEFTGAGIGAQRQAMEDKETRMASLGARMIKDQASSNETAETARLRGRGETSLLTNAVNMVQQGLEKAFRIAAEWMSTEPDDVKVKLNRDFIEARLSPEELGALVKAWQGGAVSRTTLHENLQKGEIIPPDRTMEEEQEMIEEEGGGMIGQLFGFTQPPGSPGAPEPGAPEPGAGNQPQPQES